MIYHDSVHQRVPLLAWYVPRIINRLLYLRASVVVLRFTWKGTGSCVRCFLAQQDLRVWFWFKLAVRRECDIYTQIAFYGYRFRLYILRFCYQLISECCPLHHLCVWYLGVESIFNPQLFCRNWRLFSVYNEINLRNQFKHKPINHILEGIGGWISRC